MKVLTVLGTRPEIIRLSCIIPKLDTHLDHILVHTGQNYDYELNQVFFDDLQLRKPDYFLNIAASTPAEAIAKVISETDKILEVEKPNAILILGDTNSSLAAIAAKRRKIPIFHMEAGNRCYDQRVPEEINRKIVDTISDINLPYSSIAREYLISEGFPRDQIVKTGSPMAEVLDKYRDKIHKSSILDELQLHEFNYIVISSHREENINDNKNFALLCQTIDELANKFKIPIVFSAHPRTQKMLAARDIILPNNVRLCKPFSFSSYIQLQKYAKFVLSDSGTITEEASILGFPAINIRDVHERPEGFEHSCIPFTGLDFSVINEAIELIISDKGKNFNRDQPVPDYNYLNVSEKILRIIVSYTHFINKRVWKK